jgi:hypothetical protein
MGPIANPSHTNPFFQLFDTVRFDPRVPLRFLWVHASTDALLDRHFEAGLTFPVEAHLRRLE